MSQAIETIESAESLKERPYALGYAAAGRGDIGDVDVRAVENALLREVHSTAIEASERAAEKKFELATVIAAWHWGAADKIDGNDYGTSL